MKKVLFISNGYAEDLAAIAIIKKLRSIYPEAKISALPIVGNAEHFKKMPEVKVIGPHWELPSQALQLPTPHCMKEARHATTQA